MEESGGPQLVGGYESVEIDLRVEDAVAFLLGRMNTTAKLERIVGARAQVVNGTNYEVTFKLDNGQSWNAVVHRSLAGDFSIIKEASRD